MLRNAEHLNELAHSAGVTDTPPAHLDHVATMRFDLSCHAHSLLLSYDDSLALDGKGCISGHTDWRRRARQAPAG